jgi:hypothetical protein
VRARVAGEGRRAHWRLTRDPPLTPDSRARSFFEFLDAPDEEDEDEEEEIAQKPNNRAKLR